MCCIGGAGNGIRQSVDGPFEKRNEVFATGAFEFEMKRHIGLSVILLGFPVISASASEQYLVSNEFELRSALTNLAEGDLIRFQTNIQLTADLPSVSANNVTIDGGGYWLSGDDQYRGLFIASFTGTNRNEISVLIHDLTIQNALARGGNGGESGGGGGGFGGALFIASGANVTVSNVALLNNSAVGGNGGSGSLHFTGGGGGMGGNGGRGSGSVIYGGGGGVGRGADGGSESSGSPGIVLGAAPGGGGSPSHWNGGANGGGGGGNLLLFLSGGGGGVGGDSGNGGYGGWGGGGGGGDFAGGNGGFGGGGGGGNLYGGAGGFGGGGGAGRTEGGQGGLGGGDGGSSGGGGGAGLGGAIFVESGGNLTIAGSFTVNGNSVAPGLGANGAGDGSAAGSGIYIHGASIEQIVFQPGEGETQVLGNSFGIDWVIGGRSPDLPLVLKKGMGTLELNAGNAIAWVNFVLHEGTIAFNIPSGNDRGAGIVNLHGGKLAGTGTGTVGDVFVQGGRIAPGGDEIGSLNIGTLDFNFLSSEFEFEFDLSNTNDFSDRINVVEIFSLAGRTLLFDFKGTGNGTGNPTTYTLMTSVSSDFYYAQFQYTNLAPGLGGTFIRAGKTLLFAVTNESVSPVIKSVKAVSPDGLYGIGDTIELAVTFDQEVVVNTNSGVPALLLETGDTDRWAGFVWSSGSNLVFHYTVQEGDVSGDLDYQSTNALVLNGAVIRNIYEDDADLTLPEPGSVDSISGQYQIVVDGIIPVVQSVNGPADKTYRAGEDLEFTVNFSEPVSVITSNGRPRLLVELDTGGTVYADYIDWGVDYTNALVFRMAVVAGQYDPDGISLGNVIALNGGVIRDAGGNDAQLTLTNVFSTAGVRVDGIAPSVISIRRQDPLNQIVNRDSVVFCVTFDEPVVNVDTGDFKLTATGGVSGRIASVSGSSGTVIDVTVDQIEGEGRLRLDLLTSGTGIEDEAGNPINGGFSGGEQYEIDVTAPAITIGDPSQTVTTAGPVTYEVTYEDRNFDSSSLAAGDVTLHRTGTADGTIEVTGSGKTWTVKISNITGSGTLGISIAAGTAVDAAGNEAPTAGPARTFFVGEPPVLSGLNDVAFGDLTIRNTPQIIDAEVSVSDPDSDNFEGGNLTVEFVEQVTGEHLSIRNEGTGAGQIGFDSGVVTYGGTVIGTVPVSGPGSGQDGESLVVSFTSAAATLESVKALIQNITFHAPGANPPPVRTVSMTVTDEIGLASQPAACVVAILETDIGTVGNGSSNPQFLQTGLMQQVVTIDNPAFFDVEALRLVIKLSAADRAKGIRVYNATGTNAAGHAYIQYDMPLASQTQLKLVIEYYVPDRVSVPSPTFVLVAVPASAWSAPGGTVQSILRQRVLSPEKAFLIDFATEAGAYYFVQYSDDMVTWKTARPAISGTGSTVQWVDNGPPKTETHPSQTQTRFYRVLKAD